MPGLSRDRTSPEQASQIYWQSLEALDSRKRLNVSELVGIKPFGPYKNGTMCIYTLIHIPKHKNIHPQKQTYNTAIHLKRSSTNNILQILWLRPQAIAQGITYMSPIWLGGHHLICFRFASEKTVRQGLFNQETVHCTYQQVSSRLIPKRKSPDRYRIEAFIHFHLLCLSYMAICNLISYFKMQDSSGWNVEEGGWKERHKLFVCI